MWRLRGIILCASLVSLPWALSQQAHSSGSPEDAARFIEQNIGLTTRPFTLEQLRANIQSRNESSRAVPNAHVRGQTDRIFVLSANGLEVEAYVPARGPILIQRITVTAAQRKLPAGLQIGRSSLDDMYQALGGSAENEKGPGGAFAWRYFNLEQTASALLWFDRGELLAGVEWRFDVD
jgi:hypothetical protein